MDAIYRTVKKYLFLFIIILCLRKNHVKYTTPYFACCYHMVINPKDFYTEFLPSTILQGKIILDSSNVFKVVDFSESHIQAEFGGPKKATYIHRNQNHLIKISSRCFCNKVKCQHAAAVILYHLKHGNEIQQQSKVLNWLNDIAPSNETIDAHPIPQKNKAEPFAMLYVLTIEGQNITVNLKLARPAKIGGFGADKPFDPSNKNHHAYLTKDDEKIFINLSWKDELDSKNWFQLSTNRDEELLRKMIDSGRCFAQSKDSQPVKYAEPIHVEPEWKINQFGEQFISANTPNDTQIFKIESLWYLDPNNQIGLANTKIPTDIFRKLLSAPPIPINAMKTVESRISQICPDIPKPYSEDGKVEKMIQPTPCLYLHKTTVDIENPDDYRSQYSYYSDVDTISAEISVAEFYFQYDTFKVLPEEAKRHLYQANGDILVKMSRDFELESRLANDLKEKWSLRTLNDNEEIIDCEDDVAESYYVGDDDEAFNFSNLSVPNLKKEGWLITAEEGYAIEVIQDSDVEWFSELDESEYDWFGLDLGVIIEGEKVNILPLIVSYLKKADLREVKKIPPDAKIPIQMSDGRTLMMPAKRLKGILNILTELYDQDPLDDDGKLILSNLSASQLDELEKIINVDNFTWLGSDKIRKLGQKLKAFESIKDAKVPKTFKATLRGYQQEGVNWLRFLNEFELGGILADDMGLGKTIQTLACLTIEQSTKPKPKYPNIIVSPTSLVSNWLLEIQKFTPHLKVLALHGADRKQHFDSLNDYDIILTSYPLILRDEEILLEKKFNYIVLDEAQFIKNHRAKATKVAFQLKAKHRLCLSGTPMENHLGELWSQFRFLAPGLLGTTEKFKRLYRTPIEKHSDIQRRKSLASRIKPFMLRRTKAEVAVDLPPKTEIIKTTSLDPIQRDLYETIRLAMDKKVRDAVKTQGLGKSHIIVLDALLKLRQTCCDPRLLKIESAKLAHEHSAKLKLLMDLVPNMVEEGRKILLFSQFTSMIDIIKKEFDSVKIKYVTLTGSTKDRLTPITQFQNGEVPVFIISLKAGGVGLNLTAADTIIHYDPWWNPAAENQATDRAHRIGQDKPVFVYKLITEGTVEETILEMQKKKKEIVEGLLSENANTKKPLESSDLSELFKPIDSVNSVIS